MTLLCNHPRPFLSRIRFTGMSASSSSKQIGPSDETGTICIAIYRVKLTVGDKDSLWTQRYAEKGFSELVDRESRKKACSHMIGYVSVNRTIIHGLSGVSPNSLSDKTVEYGHESSEVYDVTYLDGETNPCAIFRFMYRERGWFYNLHPGKIFFIICV